MQLHGSPVPTGLTKEGGVGGTLNKMLNSALAAKVIPETLSLIALPKDPNRNSSWKELQRQVSSKPCHSFPQENSSWKPLTLHKAEIRSPV